MLWWRRSTARYIEEGASISLFYSTKEEDKHMKKTRLQEVQELFLETVKAIGYNGFFVHDADDFEVFNEKGHSKLSGTLTDMRLYPDTVLHIGMSFRKPGWDNPTAVIPVLEDSDEALTELFTKLLQK